MKLASDFRQSAREALSGRWGLAIVTGIVASLLGGASYGGSGVTTSFSSENSGGVEVEFDLEEFIANPSIEAIFPTADASFWVMMSTIFAVALSVGLVLGIAFFILGSIVGVGYAKFNLNLIYDANPQINDLFDYFKHSKALILANLLRSLYIFLWSLLFVIPGIIASYSYAMVPYIMAENPELSPSEACAKSKELMNGNKMRLFCLSFSFIGWSILCGFTCGIGYIVLTPYMEAAVADFYREISGTRPVPEIDPETPIYVPEA